MYAIQGICRIVGDSNDQPSVIFLAEGRACSRTGLGIHAVRPACTSIYTETKAETCRIVDNIFFNHTALFQNAHSIYRSGKLLFKSLEFCGSVVLPCCLQPACAATFRSLGEHRSTYRGPTADSASDRASTWRCSRDLAYKGHQLYARISRERYQQHRQHGAFWCRQGLLSDAADAAEPVLRRRVA